MTAAAALLLGAGRAEAYVTDALEYAPVNYLTFRPPAAGESYIDPTFGTSVRRLSDATVTPNAADDGMLPLVNNEYSTMSPFSRDNAYLLLVHHSYFALYDGEGRFLRDLPFDINSSTEPRWSRAAPALLYYLNGNQLKRYDVETGERAVVRAFTEYAAVRGGGESDISWDGDHFVLIGDRRDIFVYEISTDTKGPVLDTTGLGGFDSVYITPDNNVLVGWYAMGDGRYQGVELYDRGMTFLRQVNQRLTHMDVTRDLDGGEVLVLAGAAGPDPACQSAVVKVRLADGARTCLVRLDWSLAVHVSAPDGDGWAFVSTHAVSDPLPQAGWTTYTNEILQVRLDGSEVRRLAHHRSRPFNDYGWTPRVSVSRDGSRLVFSSNYGLPEIAGYPSWYTDACFIDLSLTAPAIAGSQRPLAARLEEDTQAVLYEGSWLPSDSPRHSGGSARLAAAGRATFYFNGTGVRWIGYRDEWSGIARVYLDGALRAELDTFAPSSRPQEVIHAIGGLPLGLHVLTIEATGLGNPASGGAWIWVDAFEVAVRHEQDAPPAAFTGTWFTNLDPGHSRGSAALSMQAGGRIDFSFFGSGVSWIGYRDEWSGIARVFIDGALRAELDTHASPSLEQSVIYSLSGLEPGPHLLTIEATRSKSEISEGGWVWVDGFEVVP
jgi:hypothetical protein